MIIVQSQRIQEDKTVRCSPSLVIVNVIFFFFLSLSGSIVEHSELIPC